jgi:predicted MFS family arabinose efflux permease
MQNSPHALSPIPPRERWLLWSLAALQFTHIVDFMVMMPLGPQFTRIFAINDAQFGLLVSAYTLAAGVSGALASLVVDRFERKRLLLWLYAGFGLATLGCGLADSYSLLMTARVAAGVFGGVLGALVQTIVGDVVPFARRGRAMGIVMSAFSLSTVAGVPFSLWLASRWGWHAPFLAIAGASALLWVMAWATVPILQGHLQAQQGQPVRSTWQNFSEVLSERNHWRAFGLSALIMISSFCIIPYITIYMTANVGMSAEQVPSIYFAGGVATFFSARLWGALSDRWGKIHTFRLVALLALAPMMALTYLQRADLIWVLIVTTLFFVFVSGRMVPGMALLTTASKPQSRGAFMSLNGSIQSVAMGVASLVGGSLISRGADGRVLGYEHCGWLALAATLVAVWLVGRIELPALIPPPAAATGPLESSPAQPG